MQLGIGSYTYGWNVGVPGTMPARSFKESHLVEKAAAFGLKVLQLGDNLPLHEFDKQRLQAFKYLLKEKVIQLEVGAREMTALHLRRYIQLAGEMGCRLLRFVIDGDDFKPSIQEIIEIIGSCKALLEDNRITLAIENHDRIKASQFAGIIKAVDSEYVGICLDTANSLGAGEGIETIVDILAPHTVNLHIKDFGVERLEHKMGFVIDGRIAGEGMLNTGVLLERLRSYNKCHTAILEQWVKPGQNIEDTISREELWANKSIAYLKGLNAWH